MYLVAPGIRVTRGPDWNKENEDGGEGGVGTIVESNRSFPAGASSLAQDGCGLVTVRWDNGNLGQCRTGYLNAYDLRVIDNGVIGIRHRQKRCQFCHDNDQEEGVAGMLWICSTCPDEVSLCTNHYMDDKHDVTHPFLRVDLPASNARSPVASMVPPRKGGRKVQMKGIFKGAKVERGQDWIWKDQDGGQGKTGKVLEIQDWGKNSVRSVANVNWQATDYTNVYRVGHKGKVDVQCVQVGLGGSYYIDHLPVPGKQESLFVSLPQKVDNLADFPSALPVLPSLPSLPPPNIPIIPRFQMGEKVCISVRSPSILQELQENHGGFNPKMLEVLDLIGQVHRLTSNGDVRVQYPGEPPSANRWTINPAALISMEFAVGQQVELIDDVEAIQRLQVGHGGWSESMGLSLSAIGRVVKVYPENDLRVNFLDKEWTFNPLCLRPTNGDKKVMPSKDSGEAVSASPTIKKLFSHKTVELKRKEDAFIASCAAGDMQVLPSLFEETTYLTSHIIRSGLHEASLNGRLAAFQYLVEKFPDHVLGQVDGKNVLQVAAHRGHMEIIAYLLNDENRKKALIEARDHEGDTALHYAAYGKKFQIIEYLLSLGADVNAVNEKQCSVLHVCVLVNDIETAKILLAHPGINVNVPDAFGDTPLHEAIVKDCEAMLALICNHPSIDFNLANKRGFNSIQYAALKGSFLAMKNINEITKYALVNVRKDDGFTPMHLAALNGHCQMVTYLLGLTQVDLLAVDTRGRNCLHCAVHQGHARVMQILVEEAEKRDVKHAILNGIDIDGDTPLHIALRREGEPASKSEDEKHSLAFQAAMASVAASGLVPKFHSHAISVAAYLIQQGGKMTIRNKAGYYPKDYVWDTNIRLFLSQRSDNQSPKQIMKQQTLAVQKATSYKQCQICCETMKGDLRPVRFEPCGHVIVCVECCSRMKKCLQCQARIERKFPLTIKMTSEDEATEDEEVKSLRTLRLNDLEAKVQDLEQHYNCSICMERKKNVAFLCGHGACSECVETLRCCHMCRGPISQKINLY